MKRKFLVLSLVTCFCFLGFALEISAQRRIVKNSELHDVQNKAYQKLYERSRRVETTDETFSEGSPVKTITRIYEMLLPNRSRSYYKEKEGDKVNETEQITIDNFLYVRKNDEPWKKIEIRSGSGSGSGTGSGSYSCRQLTVESIFLNGISAQLFDELDISSETNGLMFKERRKWFGDDGSFLKEEFVEGLLSPRVENRRSTTTYEYDPNIKIEAPLK